MAGGIWTSQNKKRPGAYINFDTNTIVTNETGERGIVTLATDLSWGDATNLIEVTMDELVSGKALAKIGLTVDDAEALLIKLALQNASTLKLYRQNGAGTKATKTIDNLTVTAVYGGTFGNKIAIKVAPSAVTGFYEVQTYANGYLVDTQRAATIQELVNNDFVEFSGTGVLDEVSTTLLANGANGTVAEATAYEAYFELLKLAKWNTLAIPTTTEAIVTSAINFIKDLRDNEGKYVQAVVANTDADYEGIINNINGVVLEDGTTVTVAQFTAWVAGATAGASMVESLTGKIVEGTSSIVGLKTTDEIITGLNNGQFLLSYTQNGQAKVEKDINSLHTFSEKSYTFSKNRIIRELDEIGSGIENIWESTYLGKVTNDANGITLFKASIIDYLTDLQNRGAITDFDADNVIVERGNDVDAVLAEIAIKPLDSMEILYMTINVN